MTPCGTSPTTSSTTRCAYGEIYTASTDITQPGGHHLSDPDEISPGWTLHIPTDQPAAADPNAGTAPAVETPGAVAAEPPATAADEPEQTAGAPDDGAATAQAPAPATVADANAVEDVGGAVEDVAGWPVRTATGVGSLLAAGLVGLLATRRAVQARRRRPGMALPMPMPTGPSAAAETELRVVADPFGVAAVDTALRTLARSCAQAGQPLPSLRYARLSAGQLDLHLAEPALLPDPWTGTADATVWTLRVEEADLLDAQAAADIPAPYPALVTLGHDTHDAHVLVDLEHVGSLALIGDEDRSDAVLAALAVELATSAWADHLQVTIVAAFPELEDALHTGRIRYLPSAGLLFDELTARAENDRAALAEAGALDLAHARTSNAAPEAWFPQIVLLATPLTARQRNQLTALLDGLPRVAVAAVTTGPGPGPWALRLTEPGEDAVLDPLGLRLRPQRIDPAGYRAILDVAALTGIDPTEPYPTGHHDPADSGAHAPADHAGHGPIDLSDDGGHDGDIVPVEIRQGIVQGSNPGPPDAGQGGDTAADLGGQVAGQGGDTAPDLGGQVIGQGPDRLDDGGGQGLRQAPDPRGQAGDADALGEAGRGGVGVEDGPELGAPAAVGVVEAAGERSAPVIRLLGTVVVENTRGGIDVPHKGRALELAAFLVLRPGASSTAMQEALWPGSSSDSTRHTMTSKLRGWLGEDPAKEAYFPSYAPNTGYVLHPAVRSDWGLWCELLPDGPLTAPTERLEEALDLVRGRPFENAAAKTYTWAEHDRARMVAQIADAACELARRRGEAGDWRGAEDAAMRGLAIDPALERLWRVRILAAHVGGSPHAGQEAIDRMLTIAGQLGGDLEAETTALLTGLRTDTDPRHPAGGGPVNHHQQDPQDHAYRRGGHPGGADAPVVRTLALPRARRERQENEPMAHHRTARTVLATLILAALTATAAACTRDPGPTVSPTATPTVEPTTPAATPTLSEQDQNIADAKNTYLAYVAAYDAAAQAGFVDRDLTIAALELTVRDAREEIVSVQVTFEQNGANPDREHGRQGRIDGDRVPGGHDRRRTRTAPVAGLRGPLCLGHRLRGRNEHDAHRSAAVHGAPNRLRPDAASAGRGWAVQARIRDRRRGADATTRGPIGWPLADCWHFAHSPGERAVECQQFESDTGACLVRAAGGAGTRSDSRYREPGLRSWDDDLYLPGRRDPLHDGRWVRGGRPSRATSRLAIRSRPYENVVCGQGAPTARSTCAARRSRCPGQRRGRSGRASNPVGGPSPRALADQAVEAMNLRAGQIGIVPEPGPGKVGIVGMPAWMWIADPGEATTGPITRSASGGGITVTATARLDRVVWSMGDGATVTCAGAAARGTPYEDGYGASSSPTCGYTYTRMSDDQPSDAYTVTATSYWTVTWSGGGASGTIPLDLSRSTQITVGEIQVLITG